MPLGTKTTDAEYVSCEIRDKRPEEEEEDLNQPQRSETLDWEKNPGIYVSLCFVPLLSVHLALVHT